MREAILRWRVQALYCSLLPRPSPRSWEVEVLTGGFCSLVADRDVDSSRNRSSTEEIVQRLQIFVQED